MSINMDLMRQKLAALRGEVTKLGDEQGLSWIELKRGQSFGKQAIALHEARKRGLEIPENIDQDFISIKSLKTNDTGVMKK